MDRPHLFAGLAVRVPVPHEGLGGRQHVVVLGFQFGVPVPHEGLGERENLIRGLEKAQFPFPMRG